MDQDQLNPYVANEGYVVRVPHHPHMCLVGGIFADSRMYIHASLREYKPESTTQLHANLVGAPSHDTLVLNREQRCPYTSHQRRS